MAVLIPDKFIYLSTPHTASIATTRALATLEGAVVSNINEAKDLDFKHSFPKGTHHSTLEELKRRTPEYFTGREISVTTVRNPFDLLVTWWLRQRRAIAEKSGHEPTFGEYVETVDEGTTGGPYIRDGRIFWLGADEVLRYESLQEDLDRLLRRLGLPTVELVPTNVTGEKGPWRSYYDEGIRAVAERRFGEEAKEFGYSFSG